MSTLTYQFHGVRSSKLICVATYQSEPQLLDLEICQLMLLKIMLILFSDYGGFESHVDFIQRLVQEIISASGAVLQMICSVYASFSRFQTVSGNVWRFPGPKASRLFPTQPLPAADFLSVAPEILSPQKAGKIQQPNRSKPFHWFFWTLRP